jgi:hypothetical protein
MIVGHVNHVSPPPAPVWVSGAVIAGLVAAVAMNVPMSQLSTGYVPATVVASLLQQTVPSHVSLRDAIIVHHAVGPIAAVCYAIVGLVLDTFVPPLIRVAGLSLLAHLLAAAGIALAVYAVFAWGVLPRYGGAARDDTPLVRRHWLLASTTFGLVLAVAVPVIIAAVR